MRSVPDPREASPPRSPAAMASIPFGLLTISVVLTVAVRSSEDLGALWPDLALSAAVGLWMLGAAVPRPWTARGPLHVACFLAVWWVLTAALVIRAPWYGFFAFSGYLLTALHVTGRAQPIGLLATAILTGTSQSGGLPGADESAGVGVWLVLIAVNATLATFFYRQGDRVERQSEERRRAMVDLEAANGRLERSLRVNAELQEALLTRAREAGVSAERQRMAGEIHDTLAQDLVGIITQLEAAEAALPAATPEVARRRVEVAAELARGALGEARRSVQALRPAPLDAARLPDALGEVAARWSDIHGVDASVTTHGEARPLRPELEVTMLRTAQEALANVARHAEARRVGVTLSYMEDVVTLDVRDDGIGFRPAPATRTAVEPEPDPSGLGGFGLIAMRERIQGVAGTLTIESEPGSGTALSATLPALVMEQA